MENNKDQKQPALVAEIMNLKGNNPKLMGYDYFHVIYATAVALILSMIFVYFAVDDPTLKKMVMG